MADTDARPVGQDELVADIDRTRAQLARTIDAISDRVNPKRNVDRAMEQFRQRADEIGQRVNQEVGQRVNQIDPVVIGAAAAAVLVGATVLFLVRRRKH